MVKESPLCYAHGRVLYSALSRYLDTLELTESVNIVETGTARGFSSLCMARALQDKARDGKIITLDILPHRFDMYWNCIDDLGGKKTRQELLTPWKELVSEAESATLHDDGARRMFGKAFMRRQESQSQ